MPDALKDFAIQVQHMREAQRACIIQRVTANKLKTKKAIEEEECISAESRRLEKLVDESVSIIMMAEMSTKKLNCDNRNLNHKTMFQKRISLKVFFNFKNFT